MTAEVPGQMEAKALSGNEHRRNVTDGAMAVPKRSGVYSQ
jgi:hypothetical protein